MRRSVAVEPVMSHVEDGHRMGRNHLKGRDRDRANAVLAAAGYNFKLITRWFEALWRAPIATILRAAPDPQIRLKSCRPDRLKSCRQRSVADDYIAWRW